MTRSFFLLLVAAVAFLFGCRREPPQAAPSASTTTQTPPPTNRVEIPATVRKNLGITFANVKPRNVARTIRVPGRFEIIPQARREYRTMLGGRVELHVVQYEQVEPGTLLYALDSPQWRELQERLNETESQLQQARARADTIEPLMAAHERLRHELENGVAIWTERVEQLEQSRGTGVVTAEEFARARATLATTRAEWAEVLKKEVELSSRRVEVQAELFAAQERSELLLMNASSLLGHSAAELTAIEENSPQRHPRWREIKVVEVRAASGGVVESIALTNGAWATESSMVLTTVEPERVRFRARGLQSDLGRLRDGLPATIIPPKGGSIDPDNTMGGTIQIGISGDPDERTIEVVVKPERPAAWGRDPGVVAHLEIVAEGTESPELAIPLSATIRDGLQTVFFRRDPANPDKVIRVEADLGVNDGHWVVVSSGLREGDEVVMDGVYQLMLATSGSIQKGGHFHADGTFHEGDK